METEMNRSLLVVIPVLDNEMARPCIESILMEKSSAGFEPDELLIIDNTKEGFDNPYGLRIHRNAEAPFNNGTARSWNIGAQEVLDRGLDYLVICSAVMQFGPELHCTFRWQMEQFWDDDVIEAEGHSWHLIAIHRRIFEEIGLFDPNYYPAYFEAVDFAYRMRMVGKEGGWIPVWVNALSRGSAMHVNMLDCPADPLLKVYAHKWGGAKGFEKFDKPYGLHDLDYYEDTTIPELIERYGLKRWW